MSGCSGEEVKDTGKITVITGEKQTLDTVTSSIPTEVITPESSKIEFTDYTPPKPETSETQPQATISTEPYVEQPSNPNLRLENGKVFGAIISDGYKCVDGTPAYGDSNARGKANSCYGHKGWEINH